MEGKMPRMRTSDEIFKRLKWDETCSIRADNVTIGYEDRFLGILEITIPEFEDPDADIPFHRIRYFRTTDTGDVFWDRRRRLDLLTTGFQSTSTVASSARSTKAHRTPANMSGLQKKKLLQEKRLAKREDTKVKLVEDILTEQEQERAQAQELTGHLAHVHRQHARVQRRTIDAPALPAALYEARIGVMVNSDSDSDSDNDESSDSNLSGHEHGLPDDYDIALFLD